MLCLEMTLDTEYREEREKQGQRRGLGEEEGREKR